MSEAKSLVGELEQTWRRTDALFAGLQPEALLARPDAERPPFLYYLGHLPAFAWRELQSGLADIVGASARPDLDDLFLRPPVSKAGGVQSATERDERASCDAWPRPEEVLAYRDEVRTVMRSAIGSSCAGSGASVGEGPGLSPAELILHAVIEHELIHQESLAQMATCLEPALKRQVVSASSPCFDPASAPRSMLIPGGRVVLGAEPVQRSYLWSHEVPERAETVAPFRMDRTPIMNGEFFEFVSAGGYSDPAPWTTVAWRSLQAQQLTCPRSWRRDGGDWFCRGLHEDLPLTRVFDWPAFVSWAEASAFLSWRGQRLPTEAESVWAAYGTPEGGLRCHPWGDASPAPEHGNFNSLSGTPMPVGTHPGGASAFGILELVGNGWEWTGSAFRKHVAFGGAGVGTGSDSGGGSISSRVGQLPELAAATQDEEHVVRLGASWATPNRQLRRSFRQWARPHDFCSFGKFRGVSPA